MRNAQPFLRMETPPLRVGNVLFTDGNASFVDRGMCSLRMETPPLRVGNVLFADGNAAARTFGRAHRRRPYHFSCGSVSEGRRKRRRRWTKTRKGRRKRLRRWTKTRKGWRKRLRRWTKTRKGCRKRLRRWTKSRKGCRKRLCRWIKTREVAWWEDLMEAGRGGACVPARVALQGRIHR